MFGNQRLERGDGAGLQDHAREMTPARSSGCRPWETPAPRRRRELLAGVGDPVRIHREADPPHAVEIGLAVHLAEELPLLEPDAVLAGDRSAQADAQAQDLRRQDLRAIVRAGLAAVVEDERVEVAVAGVEHVGDADAVRSRQRFDGRQRLAQPGTRDDAVLHDEVRAEASDRRERALAALPDPGALVLVGRDARVRCAGCRQDPHQPLELHGHLRVFALELHDQDGRRARWGSPPAPLPRRRPSRGDP